LLDGLSQQHVQDWLDFSVVVEKVVVSDLGNLVDTSFLGDVGRCLGSLLKFISLNFYFDFGGLLEIVIC
jgi:hypothetical protein